MTNTAFKTDFGNFLSSNRLCELLENKDKLRAKFQTIYARYKQSLYDIENLKDPRTRSLCASLLKIHNLNMIDDIRFIYNKQQYGEGFIESMISTEDKKLFSYFENVIITEYRIFIRNNE